MTARKSPDSTNERSRSTLSCVYLGSGIWIRVGTNFRVSSDRNTFCHMNPRSVDTYRPPRRTSDRQRRNDDLPTASNTTSYVSPVAVKSVRW